MFVFESIKIQSISKSTFSDLRNSDNKDKTILMQYQYDWQHLSYKANLFVSYVKNIENWVKSLILIGLFVYVLSLINTGDFQSSSVGYDNIINIDLNNVNDIYSEDSIKWKELILDIEQKNCRKIYIIIGEDTNINVTDEFNKYNYLDVNIYTDCEMKKNTIKILKEK